MSPEIFETILRGEKVTDIQWKQGDVWSAFFIALAWFEDPNQLQELYDFDDQSFRIGELAEKAKQIGYRV